MICLSRDEIGEYLQGKLPENRSDVVEEHLRKCDSCEEFADSLEASGDSLLQHLRITPAARQEPSDPRWNRCLDSLRNLPLDLREQATASPAEQQPANSALPAVYHYQLRSIIGRGGMGIIYRSVHPQLHRDVAVKLLSASGAADAQSISRFQREMRAAGSLDHPGIVRALDAGTWNGTYFLVMEFINGIDLSRLLRTHGPLSAADAAAIARQAAEALHYAHQQQVIHRDIKPSNLMLSSDARVKILDFGLARFEHGGLTHGETTTAGRLVGTLDYIAPEQALGATDVGPAVDIYALGATIYRLLSGQPPHGSSHSRPILQQLKRLTEASITPINQLRSDLPDGLCEVVMRMLESDASRRPPTALAVVDELEPFVVEANLQELADKRNA